MRAKLGWLVLGAEGFSGTNTVPQLRAYVLIFAWSIWLFVGIWRTEQTFEAPPGTA